MKLCRALPSAVSASVAASLASPQANVGQRVNRINGNGRSVWRQSSVVVVVVVPSPPHQTVGGHRTFAKPAAAAAAGNASKNRQRPPALACGMCGRTKIYARQRDDIALRQIFAPAIAA